MATSNTTEMGVRALPYLYQTVSTRTMTFTNESVSFTNNSGFQSSSRPAAGVPSDEFWMVQSVRVHTNAVTGKVAAVVRATDADGTTHAVFPFNNASNIGFSPLTQSQDAGWIGQFYLLPGWKLTAAFQNASDVDSTSNWQYIAIRLPK